MRSIPPIRTARLTLRAMIPQDFESYANIWVRPEAVAGIGGAVWTRSDAWQAFLRNAGHWAMVGYGQWAIQPHGAQDMIGQAGFYLGPSRLGGHFDTYPEAGWTLHPDAQGQGLGEDAARAAHDWFDRVITGPLVCRIALKDARALAIAKALGYAPLRDIEHDVDAVRLLFRRGPPGGPSNLMASADAGQG